MCVCVCSVPLIKATAKLSFHSLLTPHLIKTQASSAGGPGPTPPPPPPPSSKTQLVIPAESRAGRPRGGATNTHCRPRAGGWTGLHGDAGALRCASSHRPSPLHRSVAWGPCFTCLLLLVVRPFEDWRWCLCEGRRKSSHDRRRLRPAPLSTPTIRVGAIAFPPPVPNLNAVFGMKTQTPRSANL